MTVYVLQHAEPEIPGSIADVLAGRGIALQTIRTDLGQRVPSCMEGRSGLVVMGGPMGVYEVSRYPHLQVEIDLIHDALAREAPVLGVCLGSQLLAAALKANVAPAQREVGWYPITLTEAASEDPLWKGVDRTFEVFHWHGDAFDLPQGAVSLASSERTACQAFRHGSNAYGFLFHMEMSEPMVRGMVESFGHEIAAAGGSEADILSRVPERVRAMRERANVVFRRWADLLAPPP